jgi:hypothetical protein
MRNADEVETSAQRAPIAWEGIAWVETPSPAGAAAVDGHTSLPNVDDSPGFSLHATKRVKAASMSVSVARPTRIHMLDDVANDAPYMVVTFYSSPAREIIEFVRHRSQKGGIANGPWSISGVERPLW